LDFGWFLGKQVRQHQSNKRLLELLAHSQNGRKYFYEWFVDEDDPGNYFSKALKTYYEPQCRSIGEKLFFQAYLDSKRIYRGIEVENMYPKIYTESLSNLHELHYHQISRLFEMRILYEFRGLNRYLEIEKIVEELLPIIVNKHWRDQNWMLMRPIKALVFTGHFNALIENHHGLRNQIKKQFIVCEGTMLSTADLALQFIVHASKEFKDLIQIAPTRLRNTILNEEKYRRTLECATAILYSKPLLRQSMEKNLKTFTSKNEQSWVPKLLNI
jgi:hypothetical protein